MHVYVDTFLFTYSSFAAVQRIPEGVGGGGGGVMNVMRHAVFE